MCAKRYHCCSNNEMIDYTKVKGVIHIGASVGQERVLYSNHNLNVLWIEPIPEIFKVLQDNIKGYSNQKCLNYLVSGIDNKEYTFNISNNNGESSSILELNLHKKIWPNVHYINSIRLPGKTLPTIISENSIDISNYNLINIDTQGTELMILKSSISILNSMDYVFMEVADMDSYEGCCKLNEVNEFFQSIGYKKIGLSKWNTNNKISEGNYYDALYERIL